MAAKKSPQTPTKEIKSRTPPPTKKSQNADEKTKPVIARAEPNRWFTYKVVATLLAFCLRFWNLSHPDQVVFDEVHFGKFASHYLQREYYFDLHPPLAKLMFAAVGWLVGYDGKFKFDNIGDNYIIHAVPYVAYRSLAALLGSVTVTLVFSILENCGFSAIACFTGASILIFDTAQITQTRLILLDAALTFFMVSAVYCYVRFRQQRHNPFSRDWWVWLSSTGFFLSCVISTKYVGLFTYLMIGVAVCADLWYITDLRGKPESQRVPLRVVIKHFVARLQTLIVVPFIIYLFWFYVHFSVLSYSGPGNSHMSPEFQATLQENPVVKEALDIHFYDTVTIQGASTDAFLHSHPSRYPLQYDDGRISSQGQQVTGYSVEDYNNLWQILPPVPIETPEALENKLIVGSQQIMLRHVATDTYLLTHDVASPGYPTNEEFTTVPKDIAYGERHDFCLFDLELLSGGDVARTKLSNFRLRHVQTKVAMWLADNLLPEWGFQQFEVNGNKKIDASGTTWYFGRIDNVATEEERSLRRTVADGNVAPRRSFWVDYYELQTAMFRSNNQLTVTHPYMSSPWEWPILNRGISFWSNTDNKSQIYLIGNYAGWYIENTALLLFVIIFVFDKLAELREFDWLTPYARYKLNTTLLWLFLGWAFHYFPFYLMGRQLFLHHYLPAHVLAALLTAGLLDFITGQLDTPQAKLTNKISTVAVSGVLVTAIIANFVYFAPLVYGLSLSTEGVQGRQWFNIQLHFNK